MSLPKINPFQPPDDFVAWVKSINKSFLSMIRYAPFEEYCAQAIEWKNNRPNTKSTEKTERIDAIKEEVIRLRCNSLYYMEAFNYYKEMKAEGGKLKTTTCMSQKVLCFILDLGISAFITKARGIRASSTFLPVLGMKARINKNLHAKFVCSDTKKVEGLFEDKLKFSYEYDPEFMRVNVGSDRRDGMEFFYKIAKGETGGLNSKIIIHAPSKDVINGLNPDIVVIDEAASIAMFKAIMQQGRPAMFTFDPVTEERSMTKQVIAWGTSQPFDGKSQNVSEEFLHEWKRLADEWDKDIYTSGIVPIFFDWSAVPGLTQEMYEQERSIAEGTGKDIDIKAFRNNYPSCVEDILLSSVETLIPYEEIAARLDNINLLIKNRKLVLERGYFIPIYDRSQPLPPEIGSPFKIIGAEWYPTPDGATVATTTIFMRPDHDWIDRYYQGTDPIESQAGSSNFSSSIWDNLGGEQNKTIAACMSFRPVDYRHAYEQAYCLHLFYSNPSQNKFIPELLEINIGMGYLQYCEIMKYGYNIISNKELPLYLQVGDHLSGISKRSNNAPKILDKTYDLMKTWGSSIFIDHFWIEAKTYIKHNNKMGYGVRFSPADTQFNRDDRIDSCTYAYIASLCYEDVKPKNIKSDSILRKKRRIQKMVNGHLVYADV